MDPKELSALFRSEFSKIVAVVAKTFGLEHLQLAEDIVSETFLLAIETWGTKGTPDNPSAWLYTVAKNKMIKFFQRDGIYKTRVVPHLKENKEERENEVNFFSLENIKDSQLQMIFAICNPIIVTEAQIGLALRILAGFRIEEIAEAFLTNKETINKRLYRAKEKLRSEKVVMELPGKKEIGKRLDSVLHVIYLLFNEGYYASTANHTLRKDLCLEALRLGLLLTEEHTTNLPKTNALVALMCYHASRFDARQGSGNEPVLYEQQNRNLWDQVLIEQGNFYLLKSAKGVEITSYHLEARIAYFHSGQVSSTEKWTNILSLYDQLILINHSPTVLLNRIYALFKVKGPEAALRETNSAHFPQNQFYYTLLGELYFHLDPSLAKDNFALALQLAKTNSERDQIAEKLQRLQNAH
jgi:RNA polymerase sigma factor (sigma-70 family)